jgi:hypothetical protein
MITEAVVRAWKGWHRLEARCKIIIQTFRDTGISLPVDGSHNHELNIKKMTNRIRKLCFGMNSVFNFTSLESQEVGVVRLGPRSEAEVGSEFPPLHPKTNQNSQRSAHSIQKISALESDWLK